MLYCLDTNVYIEAYRRYYAFDIAPGFWDGLIRLAEQQVICSPTFVYDEISSSKDALAHWAKSNKEILFVEIDEITQNIYTEIINQVVFLYEPQHVQKFLEGADPWVIAYAKSQQLSVVTIESLKNESPNKAGKIGGKIKIPNICQRFDVVCEDTFALLRAQKIILR
ncbi:MAG: DUF4411 family protein [Anaerolineales bacterium]